MSPSWNWSGVIEGDLPPAGTFANVLIFPYSEDGLELMPYVLKAPDWLWQVLHDYDPRWHYTCFLDDSVLVVEVELNYNINPRTRDIYNMAIHVHRSQPIHTPTEQQLAVFDFEAFQA